MDDVTQLIARCLAGHKQAWDAFVDDYSRWIYHSILGTARHYGSSMTREDADELTQDVFCILLEKGLKQFKGREKPRLLAYIRRIAVCRTINFLKRSRVTVSIDEQADGFTFMAREAGVCWPDTGASYEKEDLLKQLLSRLTLAERRLLELCYFEHVPAGSIAGMLQISVEAYYVRKNRALKKLKNLAVEMLSS